MAEYQCPKCGCKENSAYGLYHTRFQTDLYNWEGKEELKGQALCSACAPATYKDGKPSKFGMWHGKFKRVFLPKGMFVTANGGNLVHRVTGERYGDYISDTEYPDDNKTESKMFFSTECDRLQIEVTKQETQLKQNLKTFCSTELTGLYKATPETRAVAIRTFNDALDEVLSGWMDAIYVEPIENQNNGYEIAIRFDDHQQELAYKLTVIAPTAFLLDLKESMNSAVDKVYRLASIATITNRVNYAFHIRGLRNPDLIKF